MVFEEFLPCSFLSSYVKRYYVRHFTFADDSPIPFKPYAPRPEHSLAFFPRDREGVEYICGKEIVQRPSSVIIGQHTIRTNRHLGRNFIVFIVSFQPCVLYRLLGVPLHELTNTFCDAEVFFSRDIRSINERLSSTDSFMEMKQIVERFLLDLVKKLKKPPHALDTVSNLLLQDSQTYSLDWLADQSCLSPRQFQRIFIERMGIGPKLYARIARFDKAFRMKNKYPQYDWLTIALACGYTDYQHLVRDYKEFALVTPSVYYLEDSKAPERCFGRHES